MNDRTIFNFTLPDDIDYYNSLIYGKGVLIFQKLFKSDIEKLRELFLAFKCIDRKICLDDFMEVGKKILDTDVDYIINKYVMR